MRRGILEVVSGSRLVTRPTAPTVVLPVPDVCPLLAGLLSPPGGIGCPPTEALRLSFTWMQQGPDAPASPRASRRSFNHPTRKALAVPPCGPSPPRGRCRRGREFGEFGATHFFTMPECGWPFRLSRLALSTLVVSDLRAELDPPSLLWIRSTMVIGIGGLYANAEICPLAGG